MAKRPGSNPKNEWAFFDVVYEDGSQRSNRRVPLALLGGIEKDEPALGYSSPSMMRKSRSPA